MAIISQEVVIGVSIEYFFDLLVDYERYPEFVPNLKRCRVKTTNGHKDVEYELDLGLKRVCYTLRHIEERPHRLSWSLVAGDLLKVSNGFWELSNEGGGTRARYSIEIQITKPALIPQAVVNRISDELIRVQLPKTLQAFKARSEGGSRSRGGLP